MADVRPTNTPPKAPPRDHVDPATRTPDAAHAPPSGSAHSAVATPEDTKSRKWLWIALAAVAAIILLLLLIPGGDPVESDAAVVVPADESTSVGTDAATTETTVPVEPVE